MDAHLEPEADARSQKIDKVTLLSHCSLFSGLSQWELKSISQLMRLVEYKKDEIVYKEGKEADSFYVIVSGRFEATVWVGDKKKVLAYLRRGDYFGEMSLLTNQPHSATLHALSDSLILELKKDDFKKTVEHNATVSLELSRRLSSRLSGHNTRSRSLFRNDVISVFGNQPMTGRSSFSINLAASLLQETHQKIILLDMSLNSGTVSRFSANPPASMTQFRNIESAPPQALSAFVIQHAIGFDILTVAAEDSDSPDIIIPLLNHLAVEYRFIVVDLPTGIEETVLKTLAHSDSIFFVTDGNLNNVNETSQTVLDLEKTLSLPEDKIFVVINEVLLGIRTTHGIQRELFGKKRCFLLPATPSLKDHLQTQTPFVVSEPDAEYSRVVRHIARSVSNNLIGLALGSGAALGLAQIGVLKVLEREKIPIDIISGASIGALIGSLFAVGKTAHEIEEIALGITAPLLLGHLIDFNLMPVRGFLHGSQVMRHFRKHLGNKTFENCRIPLKICVANLTKNQTAILDSGFISDAVRASIAIPAIFKPVFKDGDVIVDGGILSPLPIRVLQESGANKVIAVNVFPTSKDLLEKQILAQEASEKEKAMVGRKNWALRGAFLAKKLFKRCFSPNIFDILMNTIQSMESEIAEIEGESADVLIRPVVPDASWMELYKPAQFIKRGEEEALRLLPKIKALVSQQLSG